MVSKTERARRLWQAGDKLGALKLAKTWRIMEPEQRKAITRACSALCSPGFYRSLGDDPEKLIEEGFLALGKVLQQ